MSESKEPDVAEEMKALLSGSPVAFQFTDLKAMAARILRRANEIAQQKLAAADRHVKEVERAAQEEGFQKGYNEGYAKGEAEGRTQGEAAARDAFGGAVQGVVPTLQALLHELDEDRIRLQTQAEADLLLLAMEVARRVVRQSIAVDENAVRPVLRDAIALMTMRNDLVVRVHPDDLAAVEAELPTVRGLFTDLGRVDVAADAGVERGGVRVVGRDGEVDLQIQEQLDALERALLGVRTDPEASRPAREGGGGAAPELMNVQSHGEELFLDDTVAQSNPDTPAAPQPTEDSPARPDGNPPAHTERKPSIESEASPGGTPQPDLEHEGDAVDPEPTGEMQPPHGTSTPAAEDELAMPHGLRQDVLPEEAERGDADVAGEGTP